jgi:predicted DNA-binding ribbon-helix-helix protein
MRTTIDLSDALFRELKAVAARRGTSLKSVIISAVEAEVRRIRISGLSAFAHGARMRLVTFG